MNSRHAVVLSFVVTSLFACADDPVTTPPPSPVMPGAGSSAGGGAKATGGSPSAGGSSATGGTTGGAAGSGGPGGMGAAGSPVAMGVAGMYADENPICDDTMSGAASGSAASGSAGRSGGGAGSAGSGSAGRSGGGAGGASGAPSGPPATFSEVYNIIKCNGCGLCHGGSANLNFNNTKSETYEALLGSDQLGKPAGTAAEGGMCTGQKRVVPGMPDQSLLYVKVAGTQTCGTVMPPMPAPPFTAAQIERVRSWIAAGAKKD